MESMGIDYGDLIKDESTMALTLTGDHLYALYDDRWHEIGRADAIMSEQNFADFCSSLRESGICVSEISFHAEPIMASTPSGNPLCVFHRYRPYITLSPFKLENDTQEIDEKSFEGILNTGI